jgi:Ca2+-binding EF-hand superfamily protein
VKDALVELENKSVAVSTTGELKSAMALPEKVSQLWSDLPKDKKSEVNRLKCWDVLLADTQLASLIGNSDPAKGLAILQAMKDVRALDTSGDGKITKEEFKRLNDPEVLAAAESRVALIVKVERMWDKMRKDKDGKIERLECWNVLLKDSELATLLGESDAAKGLEIMHAMKAARALDYSGNGFITVDKIRRLYNPTVVASAKSRAMLITHVHEMWAAVPKDDIVEGRVERLACWDFILSDRKMPDLIGNLNPSKGKNLLVAMKEARALDILRDGYVIEAGFCRLYNPIAIQSAEVRVALPYIVDNLWKSFAKDANGDISRLECWEIIVGHEEFASVIGSGDVAEGVACLNVMKEINLGRANRSGNIDGEEFRRLCDPQFIAAAHAKAALPRHLTNVWNKMPKDNRGRADRFKSWDALFANEAVKSRIGSGDVVKGQNMLETIRASMNETRDKKMTKEEVMRLCDESVLVAAEAQALEPLNKKVRTLWDGFQKTKKGRVLQAEVWENLLADDELANIIGHSDIPRGQETLRAMRSAWALVNSSGESVSVEDFQLLFNSGTYATAVRSMGLASMLAEIWAAVPKSADGRTQWLMCWDTVQGNDKFASLLGNSNLFRGKALLASMKELMAANAPAEWVITQDEFMCLAEPALFAAAEHRVSLQFKVDLMWKQLSTDDSSKFECSQCWQIILADDELAALVGEGDALSGRSVLGAIKNTKALDDSKTDRDWMSEVEFRRLYDPHVLLLNARKGGTAATNIQARARGVQTRQKHAQRQSAAVKIGATARGRAGRKHVRECHDSAVKLQARARGNAARAAKTGWTDDYLATKVYSAGWSTEAAALSSSAISRAVEVHLARLTRDPSMLAALVQQVPSKFQSFLEGDDFLVRCDLEFDALLQQQPTYKAGETEQDDTAGVIFEAMHPVLNDLARDLGKREPAASAVSSWVATEGHASSAAVLPNASTTGDDAKLTPATLLRILEVFDYDKKGSVDRFEFSDCAKFFSALCALGTDVTAASYGREEVRDPDSSGSSGQEQTARDALAFARGISAEPFGVLGGSDPLQVGSCCITDCTAAELDTDEAVPHTQPGSSPGLSSAAMGPATATSSSSSSATSDQQARRRAAVYAWLSLEVPATQFPPMVAPKLTRAGDACHHRYLKGLLTQGTAVSVHVVHAKGPNLSSAISNSRAVAAGGAAVAPGASIPSGSSSSSSSASTGFLDVSAFAPAAAAGLVWERMRQLAAERGGLTQMLTLFQELDADGSGAINVDEFQDFLERKIQVRTCSPEIVAAVVAVADTDGDGSVDYGEMLSVLGSKRINVHGLSPAAGAGLICGRLRQVAAERGGLVKILQLFQELDRDLSGSITPDEFKAFLEALHIAGADAATAAAVVAAADLDGDGAVDYEEFLKMLGTPLSAAAKSQSAVGGNSAFEESDGLSGLVEPLNLASLSTAAAAGLVWGRLRQLAAMEGGAAKVRYLFEELDVDGSGTATATEFGGILERLELYGATPEVQITRSYFISSQNLECITKIMCECVFIKCSYLIYIAVIRYRPWRQLWKLATAAATAWWTTTSSSTCLAYRC